MIYPERDDTPKNQRAWAEKKLERECCQRVKAIDGTAYKFVSPGHVSVPDRIICLPSIRPFFVEFKRWGAKPTEPQIREFKRLFLLGQDVYFIDNLNDFTMVIDSQMSSERIFPWHVSPPGEIYDKLWGQLQ